MFGYDAAEMVGSSIERLLSPDRPDEERRILENAKRGETRLYETVRMRKDGTPVDISLAVSPIRDAHGTIVGVSSIARDITERKRAEEQILRLNTELEHRVQLRTAELTAANQELEAFTYSVAHDLRAPLRHIDAFTRILQEDFAGSFPPEAAKLLETIRHGSENMSRLVNDLLNLAHVGRQEMKQERVTLNLLVEESIAELKRETEGRGIEWRVGNLPSVEGDPGLLKQVFANLLSNAVKYSRPRRQAIIEVGTRMMNDEMVIFVRDNGVGFNMKYADKLFGVFQRLHRAEEFEGTGVGLAIVERVVRRHGGHIWAESEVDKGATFYFSLDGLKEPRRRAEDKGVGSGGRSSAEFGVRSAE
jgi:PAS domain S-box-containing protein